MKIFRVCLSFFLFVAGKLVLLASVKRVGPHPLAEYSVDISMPGIKPDQDEQYTCYSAEVLQDGYIVEFVPTASANRVHHMLLYGCAEPAAAPGEPWSCLHTGICKSGQKILYAWARNAPALALPENVAVPIGKTVGVHYFVLQMHYSTMFDGNAFDFSGVTLQMTSQVPKYIAGIYLFVTGSQDIPPHTKTVAMNITCDYNGNATVYPFAYRTHTHALGRVVSAYKFRDEQWTKIGKGNPQWPQRFYPVDKPVEINNGDSMAAQCIFDSTERHDATSFGAHGHNEMCNFYMYYYVDSKHPSPFGANECANPFDEKLLFASYPPEASAPFSENTEMSEKAKPNEKRFGVVESKNWPKDGSIFGQVAGMTVDKNGDLLVFHRVDRVWNDKTFDLKYQYRQRTDGPIMDDTVLTIGSNGSVIKRWGRGFFYMPHGVFMDSKGFLWTTDVALHQVLKFDVANERTTPILTLGKEFQPGSDNEHFCQPSGVAVTSGGDVFVSDGYCNNRIVKFDSNGKFVLSFGEASMEILPSGLPKMGTFNLPHALALHESKRQLLVADRENGRVQIFDYNGLPVSQIFNEMFGGVVYGVAYCESLDLIYAVNSQTLSSSKTDKLSVFAFDGNSKRLMFSWKPMQGTFEKPHVLAVNPDCTRVYVGEIGPNKVWRFEVTSSGRSATSENNKGVASVVDASAKKPETAVDAEVIRIDKTSWPQLIMILTLAIAVPLLLIAVVCCCIRFRKQGGFRQMNLSLQQDYRRNGGKSGKVPLLTDAFGSRSHKGFQPLRTEDIDAMDDLTDESDTEDTLYTSAPTKNGTAALKA